MKINIETVHECASRRLDAEQAARLIREIEQQAQAEAEAEKANREPPQKKQLCILLSDPTGIIGDNELVGWVCQLPEDDSPATTLEKLHRAAYEFNISKKGRKYPVKTVGEACEAVGARFLREQGLAIKTREPVQVIVSDNRIPQEAAAQ